MSSMGALTGLPFWIIYSDGFISGLLPTLNLLGVKPGSITTTLQDSILWPRSQS